MNAMQLIGWACLVSAVLCGSAWSQAADAPNASPPPDFNVVGDQAIDERGFTSWQIDSPYQEGPNAVEVLCPDKAKTEKDARFPVIYFLQVGPDFGAWGNRSTSNYCRSAFRTIMTTIASINTAGTAAGLNRP